MPACLFPLNYEAFKSARLSTQDLVLAVSTVMALHFFLFYFIYFFGKQFQLLSWKMHDL